MKRPGNSITTKLLLLFLLVGLLSVAIVGAYSFYSAKRAIMRRTIDQLISVRAVKKQQVAGFFTEKFRNIIMLSQTDQLRDLYHQRSPFNSSSSRSNNMAVGTNRPVEVRDPGTINRCKAGMIHRIASKAIDSLIASYAAYGFTNLYLASRVCKQTQGPEWSDKNSGDSRGIQPVTSHPADRHSRSVSMDSAMQDIPVHGSFDTSHLVILAFDKTSSDDLGGDHGDANDPVSDNEILCSQMDGLIKRISREQRVLASDLFFRNQKDSVPVCLIGCAMPAGDQRTEGYVVLEVPATMINRIMLQDNSRIGLGQSGEAYLVGRDSLMRSVSRFVDRSVLRIPVHSATVTLALAGETGASQTYDYRGIRVFSAYEPLDIPGLRWVVLAEIDYEEAMVPVTGLRNDILLVSIVISLFILGFAQVITKMITQPVIRLKNAAAKLGEGNFDSKVPVGSRDEIGALAETFNTMSQQLHEERKKRIQALYDGQEMERRRISRELHDGMGQKLVGAKLQIENCNENDHGCLRKTMEETKAGLHSIVDELRRISNDLMPAALHELGLETALRNLCDETGRQLGFEVDFDAEILTPPDDHQAVYLFRIAQEGIQNIIKHAGASSVSLQLIESRGFYILLLEDNGVGFDSGKVTTGNGLSNMAERAGLLGGNCTVESEPGQGTTIRVKIPINEPAN